MGVPMRDKNSDQTVSTRERLDARYSQPDVMTTEKTSSKVVRVMKTSSA